MGANVCLSPKDVLKLLVDEEDIERNRRNTRSAEDTYNEVMANIKFTPDSFMKLCPVLLAQIEEEACKDPPVVKDMQQVSQQMYWCKYLVDFGRTYNNHFLLPQHGFTLQFRSSFSRVAVFLE